MSHYTELKHNLARGWNTWNTRSVLSHVLLPEGFALNLGIKEYATGDHLREALIGRQGEDDERIHPGPHAYDGSYTELRLTWRGIALTVQSAADGDDLLILVTPHTAHRKTPLLIVEAGLLWGRPGTVTRSADRLNTQLPARTLTIAASTPLIEEPQVWTLTPYLALPLDGPLAIGVGVSVDLDQAMTRIEAARARHEATHERFGELGEVHAALQTCMAWDTIYDPTGDRVVTPVSRIWSSRTGGCLLFCWDAYFAAWLAAIDHKELAYANAIEITREATEQGFVPNLAAATGVKTRDRSEPPVGALCVKAIYDRYREAWFLEAVYDDLLRWNLWWAEHRDTDGYLCWGSDPFEPVADNYWETHGVNERCGGSLESGLDNSPLYDEVPFDTQRHQLMLADVGLMALYIADCDALAAMADELGRGEDARALRTRAARYRAALQTLWCEATGLFLNRRTDTGEFSRRLAPTLFYPLLAQAASPEQAARMVAEHLYNPDEFWGEWVLPSIARNDPAYPEQDYWRGRIWAPMNLLVYLGLRRYDLPQARRDLAEASRRLLLKEWREQGHVHENYCADTGEGCNKPNSDRFYHWGGLLGLIALMEAGHMDGPENPCRQRTR